MTEVREEKSKSGSGNIEDVASHKSGSQKESSEENSDLKSRTCGLCGKVFKNERSRKAHEHHCKRKKTQGEKEGQIKGSSKEIIEGSKDLVKLREELMHAFREEMEAELEKIREERMELDRPLAEGTEYEEAETSGVVVLEADEEMGLGEEIEEIEEDLEELEPQVAKVDEGSSDIDLEELSVELENIESELNRKVGFDALSKMSEDYEMAIKRIQDSIIDIDRRIDSVNQEMEESGSRYGSYQNMVKELKKLDEKTLEILEEIGFGESMNVAKIPPNILESVYETTIEDIVNEIRRNRGSHDAESIIKSTLEDIRTRTSGSELFYFDGRMMRTRNLAKAIQHKLISAKQVQTTYDELLSKLLEYIPGYKAKNFRAMIKLKSQEYAVDKTTLLLETFELLKEDINHLKNMVGSVSNRQNTIELEINNMLKSKVEIEDIERIKALLEEISGRQNQFDEALVDIKKEQEDQKEDLSRQLEAISNKLKGLEEKPSAEEKEDHLKPIVKKAKKGADKKKTAKKAKKEHSEDESRILSIIPDKGFTLNRIQKEIQGEIEEGRVEECVESLVNKGIVSTVKRGRHTLYIVKKETEVKKSA
ncbi:MAG: hypothetical protein JSV56_11820 [Methanomassiliicoccales archaeon]|nr:MAG: hypothetical protein JSV56_11820 [Methanomassiliicoccales archaeon]